MSIFGRMFRRGGPRDPDDPGDNGEEGEETTGTPTADDQLVSPARGSEVHLRLPGEPDETTRPDATNPWEQTTGAEETATRPDRRAPNQYALPRGGVPRPATQPSPGNGHPPAQQRAGEIKRRTGSTRPPPPFARRISPTQPPGGEVAAPVPQVGSGAATVVPVGDAPSGPVSTAAGSGAVHSSKRPATLPALRGVATTPRRPTP